jgi:hypothetical protein
VTPPGKQALRLIVNAASRRAPKARISEDFDTRVDHSGRSAAEAKRRAGSGETVRRFVASARPAAAC